jgi:hypothetical protein
MSDPPRTPPRRSAVPTVAVASSLFVVVLVFAMGYLLVQAGWHTESIIGLMLGLLGVSGGLIPLAAKQINQTADQNETLAQITESTNGVLTARIAEAVRRAISDVQTAEGIRQARQEDTP